MTTSVIYIKWCTSPSDIQYSSDILIIMDYSMFLPGAEFNSSLLCVFTGVDYKSHVGCIWYSYSENYEFCSLTWIVLFHTLLYQYYIRILLNNSFRCLFEPKKQLYKRALNTLISSCIIQFELTTMTSHLSTLKAWQIYNVILEKGKLQCIKYLGNRWRYTFIIYYRCTLGYLSGVYARGSKRPPPHTG